MNIPLENELNEVFGEKNFEQSEKKNNTSLENTDAIPCQNIDIPSAYTLYNWEAEETKSFFF